MRYRRAATFFCFCCLCYLCVALLVAFTVGDPGYGYMPLDPDGQKVANWSESIAGARFEMKPFFVLIGSTRTLQGLTITNNSGHDVVLLGGQLSTNGRALEAKLPGEGEAKWRTVRPGATETINLFWDFREHGGDASKVLGPSIRWAWRVRIGDEERTLRVRMQRQ